LARSRTELPLDTPATHRRRSRVSRRARRARLVSSSAASRRSRRPFRSGRDEGAPAPRRGRSPARGTHRHAARPLVAEAPPAHRFVRSRSCRTTGPACGGRREASGSTPRVHEAASIYSSSPPAPRDGARESICILETFSGHALGGSRSIPCSRLSRDLSWNRCQSRRVTARDADVSRVECPRAASPSPRARRRTFMGWAAQERSMSLYAAHETSGDAARKTGAEARLR